MSGIRARAPPRIAHQNYPAPRLAVRAYSWGAAELTVPQPMSLQCLGLPRGTTGYGTGWASPRADCLHVRRRLQPIVDVQLASNDRSCGSTSGHGDSASRGAADGRGAANVPPVTYLWPLAPAPRTPDRTDRLSRHGLRLNRHAKGGHPSAQGDPARARHQERPLTLWSLVDVVKEALDRELHPDGYKRSAMVPAFAW
jgi:hypothetical protein